MGLSHALTRATRPLWRERRPWICPSDRTSCCRSQGRIDDVNTTPSTLVATFGSERLAIAGRGAYFVALFAAIAVAVAVVVVTKPFLSENLKVRGNSLVAGPSTLSLKCL